MTEPTNWWRSACRACGGVLVRVPADSHPSAGGQPWRLCGPCAEARAVDETDSLALWERLALIGDPAAATDLAAG